MKIMKVFFAGLIAIFASFQVAPAFAQDEGNRGVDIPEVCRTVIETLDRQRSAGDTRYATAGVSGCTPT